MKQYLTLLKKVVEEGTYKSPARENMPGTYSLFGEQMRFNLSEGFPILTTKKMYFKGIVTELLWFLRGDTNIQYLVDNGCNWWNEDQQNFVDKNNWTEKGSLGYQYGWLWRSWGKQDRKWQPKPNFQDPFFNSNLPNIKPSNSKYVGQIIKTIQGYEYLIYDYDSIKNIYYICFTHNGLLWEKKTSKNFNKVKYPYHKNCLGIACIGRVDSTSLLYKKLYSTWRGMINRCYDKNSISYGLYGGSGVFVDNRWLCLEYFIEDVHKLKGWEEKFNNWSKYTLEKDFGRGYIYSSKDCIWSQYNLSRLDRPVYYWFENKKTKEVYQTNNLADFGRKIGKEKLINAHSKKLIDGRLKSLCGWTLQKVEDFSNKGVDQIKELINGLKSNPRSRRHILTAWNPATLDDMALNACHAFVQFNCRPVPVEERIEWAFKNTSIDPFDFGVGEQANSPLTTTRVLKTYDVPEYYLDCQLYQRSGDLFIGVPNNIASYALLTYIIARIVNMVPGEFVHTFGDVHLYENHIEQAEEQLKRSPHELPKLKFREDESLWNGVFPNNSTLDLNFEAFTSSDFWLEDYTHHEPIKAKLSTGLK